MAFQRQAVRASTASYPRFALVIDSSLGFASAPPYSRPVRTRFRFGCSPEEINLARQAQLVGSLCKRHAVTLTRDSDHSLPQQLHRGSAVPRFTGRTAARPFHCRGKHFSLSRKYTGSRKAAGNLSHASTLRPLVSVWFQVLFHSPSRRSFHLSLTVLVHYRSQAVFSLAGWCRLVQTGFLRSRPTQGISPPSAPYVYRPFTFCGAAFQSASSSAWSAYGSPATPGRRSSRVWAAPRSLAATWGITDLFSSPGGT